MSVKSISHITLLSLLLCFSGEVFSQEIVELEPIMVESDYSDRSVTPNIYSESLIQSLSDQLKQNRSFVSYQNFTSSDIVIQYNGITLNDVTDGRANLLFYPRVLFDQVGVHELSGSYAPSFVLEDSLRDSRFITLELSSTLGYSSVFKNDLGGVNYVFFDYDQGLFSFEDEQGSVHKRKHNSFYRYGFVLNQYQSMSSFILEEHLIFSHYYRDEPGLSEFPVFYKLAYENASIAAGSILGTLYFGEHSLIWGITQKVQHMIYENESSLKSSNDFMDYWDYSGTYRFGWSNDFLDLTFSHEQQYQSKYREFRNLLNAHLQYNQSISKFQIQLQSSILTDYSQVLFPASALISYSPLEDLKLWINYSHRSRFPSFNELYFRTEFVRGDHGLHPQNSDSVGIGASYIGEYFLMDLGLTYSYNRDMIRFISVTPELFKVYNLDDYNVLELKTGIEVDLHFFDISVSYTYSYSYLCSNQSGSETLVVPMVSEHMLHTRMSFSYSNMKAELSYSYRSPYFINFQNTVSSISDHNLELSMSYSYNRWSVHLAFSNLLFQRRETALQKPLPRFQSQLSVQYSF